MGNDRIAQETGVAWYVGIPSAGKTTLAATHAAEAARRNRWPCVFVDSGGVGQLAHVDHVATLDELVQAVWSRGEHTAWIPRDASEVDALSQYVYEFKRVNLLVDEAAFWISSQRGKQGPLLRLLRAHRHALARVYLTTQHLSADVPQEALSCAPVIYVFRCTSPAVLDRLEKEYGLDRSDVSQLPQGSYIPVETGFNAKH